MGRTYDKLTASSRRSRIVHNPDHSPFFISRAPVRRLTPNSSRRFSNTSFTKALLPSTTPSEKRLTRHLNFPVAAILVILRIQITLGSQEMLVNNTHRMAAIGHYEHMCGAGLRLRCPPPLH